MNHQMIRDRAAHLSPEDLALLRENLHEQLLFRQDQLRQIAATAPRAQGPCPAGSAARAEVHVKLAASARMVLADVRAALRRIDEGHYGSCHLCRSPVGRERLLVVPQARYCARCQQVREAGR
ncbi:TraR/DksA family transcriptional regulator [Streptomyces sp. NPDC004111]|uniref:TraR/DksA family transcriptional regulator n=1 Tax=Streptomyces sp. NPDC004111 TaxID=3364690 RepID=UPI00368FC7AC